MAARLSSGPEEEPGGAAHPGTDGSEGRLMAWLGIISLGMTAEVSMIILLGLAETQRYEAGQEPVPRGPERRIDLAA
jgi:hypothetical protein